MSSPLKAIERVTNTSGYSRHHVPIPLRPSNEDQYINSLTKTCLCMEKKVFARKKRRDKQSAAEDLFDTFEDQKF